MKIRWNRESIRLRITPSEFQAIINGQPVQEGITFPGKQLWSVTLRPSDAETMISSDLHGVYLSLSEADRAHLAESGSEGVYFQIDTLLPLRYYVEKDFPCVHKPAPQSGEKSGETFTPPPGFEERKLATTDTSDD